ncbi:outer membrane insertion C- signal [Algoriphagus sp.]|uniref:outer membrane insertion C- signal n=1 Tax=Algoriphagus sp. TaxID=1872435 RepID=UPI00391BBF08
MQKIKLFALIMGLSLFSTLKSQAQELGLRFGDFYGNNVAIDGVFALGEFSRIHADVSFGGNGLGIDALWNPIYDDIPDTDFQWYAGFGPAVYLGNNFRLGAAAEIGAEYAFADVPITIGLDFRPYLFLVEVTEFRAGFGLNVRWRLP